jgi:acetyl-CoA acetyltransferase family protein
MPSASVSSFVYSAVRTPFGRYGGALFGVRPDDLAATVLTGLLAKTPDLDPARIGDVVYGNANGAGEDNRNVGRMAVLLAGLPVTVPATTVNRLCGSSLDAAMIASRLVETGDAEVAVAGGVESMSRAPWVLPKPTRAFPAGDASLVSTTLGWRLVNERMPTDWTVSLGEANEQLRQRFGSSSDRQDEFAARSHRLADRAWKDGFYDEAIVAVPGVSLARDEGIRPDSSAKTLAGLRPVSVRTARSPPATPRRSTTVPPQCSSDQSRRRRSVATRWLGSRAEGQRHSSHSCSATHPSAAVIGVTGCHRRAEPGRGRR